MNSKPWYQSATYYALAVAIVSKILMMAGLAESDAGKQAGEIVTVVLPFIGIVADLIAAWGRKRAQGPVTLTKAGAEAQNKQAGYARPLALALLLSIAIPLLMLSACQTPPHKVVQAACDPATYTAERCAKGIAETWEVYQRRAEEIVTDPATPADLKQPIQQAESTTRPAIVEMLKSAAAYKRIKDELAVGVTDEEKLQIANANLERWVKVALPRIDALGDALGL